MSTLLEELLSPAQRRVRQNLIAAETAIQIKCPHCQVGPGTPCVTFPRGTNAQFTHAKRVSKRLAIMRAIELIQNAQ